MWVDPATTTDPSAAVLIPATLPPFKDPRSRTAPAVRVSVPLMAKVRSTACPPSTPATTRLDPLTVTPAVLLTPEVPNSCTAPATPSDEKDCTKPSCAPLRLWPEKAAEVCPDT